MVGRFRALSLAVAILVSTQAGRAESGYSLSQLHGLLAGVFSENYKKIGSGFDVIGSYAGTNCVGYMTADGPFNSQSLITLHFNTMQPVRIGNNAEGGTVIVTGGQCLRTNTLKNQPETVACGNLQAAAQRTKALQSAAAILQAIVTACTE